MSARRQLVKPLRGATMATLGALPVTSCERPWDLPRALEAEWRRGGFDPEVAADFMRSRAHRAAAELEATIPPEAAVVDDPGGDA